MKSCESELYALVNERLYDSRRINNVFERLESIISSPHQNDFHCWLFEGSASSVSSIVYHCGVLAQYGRSSAVFQASTIERLLECFSYYQIIQTKDISNLMLGVKLLIQNNKINGSVDEEIVAQFIQNLPKSKSSTVAILLRLSAEQLIKFEQFDLSDMAPVSRQQAEQVACDDEIERLSYAMQIF